MIKVAKHDFKQLSKVERKSGKSEHLEILVELNAQIKVLKHERSMAIIKCKSIFKTSLRSALGKAK
jgi:hypothetical protein